MIIYCLFTRRFEKKNHLQSYLGQNNGEEVVDVVLFGYDFKYSSSLNCKTSGRSRT